MDKLVSIRIDLDKVDNARVFQGAKGRYLDIVGVLTETSDQYQNNGFVTQQITKEERQQGVKLPVLGNFKKLMDLQPKGYAPNVPSVPAIPQGVTQGPTGVKGNSHPQGVQMSAPASGPVGQVGAPGVPGVNGDDDLPF